MILVTKQQVWPSTAFANVGQLNVNNNRVMCQMYMKLPTMFDQNPPHTFDKIVKKLQKTLSKLDLDPKCQGHSRNQKLMTWGIKTCHPKKNLAGGPLVIGVTPTRTPMPTAVKQYDDPHSTCWCQSLKNCRTAGTKFHRRNKDCN